MKILGLIRRSFTYLYRTSIVGTESWLNSTIKDHEVFPEGYALYRKDRETGEMGGGVFVTVKDHLVSSEIHEFDTDCEIK